MKRIVFLLGVCVFLNVPTMASESAEDELRAFLKDFHNNPIEVLDRVPVKRDEQGNIIHKRESLFSEEDIRSGSYIKERDLVRQKFFYPNNEEPGEEQGGSKNSATPLKHTPQKYMKDLPHSYSINKPIDQEERSKLETALDDLEPIYNIHEMEARGLLASRTEREPWADSYWPVANGIIAADYSGSGSPAAKYGSLVNDGGRLTGRMLGAREWYISKYGAVPGWMGICHGWAGAAIMEQPPLKGVTVTGVNGNQIHFYLSDIKGLLSAFWAKNIPLSTLVGGRCNVSSPMRDHTGRIVDPRCYDTNPGTWHIMAVNQVGKNRRGFVIDATYDAEVWNHPVYSYRYSYFNPQTLEPSQRANRAVIPMSEYSIDKFKNLRSPLAKYVIGIRMDMTYITEMRASNAATHPRAPRKTVTYVYDLELDADKKIIGGEWYLNRHPDFLWAYPHDLKPIAPGDETITEEWDGHGPMPRSWSAAARTASSKGQPLGHVVHALLKLSREGATPTPEVTPSPDASPAVETSAAFK